MTDASGQQWWFETGGLVVDFAYTPGAELATWLAERYPELAGPIGEGELTDARALHDAVSRGLLEGSDGHAPAAEDIDVINLYAATPDIPPSLDGGTRQAGRSSARTGQALSELARQAVELFAYRERERIRECAADDCDFVFYDDSRSNNRRWCSMQRCGNRAKVRKHRAARV
jgi:predicted RNA-binding Zn ribbon-like protein